VLGLPRTPAEVIRTREDPCRKSIAVADAYENWRDLDGPEVFALLSGERRA
jgi:hypothetical protein